MTEKKEPETISCPNCKKEIRKSAKFCPFCGNKAKLANYCSQCGHAIESGEKFCSECGKDFVKKTAELPSTMPPVATSIQSPIQTSYPMQVLKRPTGIAIISVLWVLGGLYNLAIGSTNVNADLDILLNLNNYSLSYVAESFLTWAVPLSIMVDVFVILLGFAQFAVVYGFLSRKSWSHKSGMQIPVVGFILTTVMYVVKVTAPIAIETSIIGPIISAVVATIYVTYLRQSHVREWLNSNLEQKISAGVTQSIGLGDIEYKFCLDNLGLNEGEKIRELYVCKFFREEQVDILAYVKGLIVLTGNRLLLIKRQEQVSPYMKKYLRFDIPAKSIVGFASRGWGGKVLNIHVRIENQTVRYALFNVEGKTLNAIQAELLAMSRAQ